MHLKRILVALVAIPLIYLYITELPSVYFLIFLAVISALAQYEFYSMYRTSRVMTCLGIAGGTVLLGVSCFLPVSGPEHIRSLVFISIFIVISTVRLFIIRDSAAALKDISAALVGILYIPATLLTAWYLRLGGYEWIFLMLLCVWSADTAAYYIGRNFGRRKLYKEISPNKTVEGAVGSVAGGILAGVASGAFLFKSLSIPQLILIGAVLGFITIIGDLVESMFKRDAGIKDSGNIIPGHGGVLDRIDSLLFAAPALYIMRLFL